MKRARLLPWLLALLALPSLLSAQVPQGDEFQVNVQTRTRDSSLLNVAMNARGEFVVTWPAALPGGDRAGLFARSFAPDGSPRSGEILVSDEADLSYITTLAIRDDGSFLALYHVFPHVKGQIFAPDGTPLSGVFSAGQFTARDFSVAALKDGGFAVFWGDFRFRIYYRLLGPHGEVRRRPEQLGAGYGPAVAVGPQGEMVVAWTLYTRSRRSDSVLRQKLRPDGSRLGPPQVTAKRGAEPDVAFDAAGNFLLTWSHPTVFFGRRYGEDGEALGRARRLLVPGLFAGYPLSMLAMDRQGEFVLTWVERGESFPVWNVRAQRFDNRESPLGSIASLATFREEFLRIHGEIVGSDGDGRFVLVWRDQDRLLARLFHID